MYMYVHVYIVHVCVHVHVHVYIHNFIYDHVTSTSTQALPMPRTIFEKITGVPEKRPQDLTTPHSPAIVKKRKLDVTTIEVHVYTL